MKLEQRFNPVVRACACLLATATLMSAPASAFDKAIYDGEWNTPTPNISLKITPQEARFTIDGKTYTDPTPEYFAGQLATAPFLYVQAADATDQQHPHRLYLMISDTAKLHGYYDYADQSLPITLTQ